MPLPRLQLARNAVSPRKYNLRRPSVTPWLVFMLHAKILTHTLGHVDRREYHQ